MRAYSNDREGDQLANLIFASDPLLHFHYEHVHGAPKSPVPPEIRALMFAVLEDGITCFQQYFYQPSRTNEKLFLEAEEWISSNDDGVFSFNNVCETLGFNPERLRKGLLRWKTKQTGVPPEERTRLILSKGKRRGKKETQVEA